MSGFYTDVRIGKIDPRNGLKVGDIITAYWSGFFKVTGFLDRDNGGKPYPSLVSVVTVANADGKRKNGKAERQCCVSYCHKVTTKFVNDLYDIEVADSLTKKDSLLNILAENNRI